jgi:hypothetical protein
MARQGARFGPEMSEAVTLIQARADYLRAQLGQDQDGRERDAGEIAGLDGSLALMMQAVVSTSKEGS